jgi:hypothetical protein
MVGIAQLAGKVMDLFDHTVMACIVAKVVMRASSMSANDPFDEAGAVGNYWLDHIYPAQFRDGSGKYFNVVMEEDDRTSVEYFPPFPSRNRVKLTVTFLRANGEIKEVTLKKFKQYETKGVSRWEEQYFGPGEPMSFSHFSFEKLMGFLKLLTELDLANLNERRIALREENGQKIDVQTAEKIKRILSGEGGQSLIEELLANEEVTSRDIVNLGFRRKQLGVFEQLLRGNEAIQEYRDRFDIFSPQPEKVWQHFFSSNPWIFGFGLDYRFLGILQDEAHIAPTDLAGRNGSISDFLMGSTNFTVLVEVKTPETKLFQKGINRANSWQLSSDLIGSVSQILEQKASWQVRAETNARNNFSDNGELIQQRTADPKSILIIGSGNAFGGDEKSRAIKLRTFELFRRDSRNVEIVTYDELYERAKFIVGHGPAASSNR